MIEETIDLCLTRRLCVISWGILNSSEKRESPIVAIVAEHVERRPRGYIEPYLLGFDVFLSSARVYSTIDFAK